MLLLTVSENRVPSRVRGRAGAREGLAAPDDSVRGTSALVPRLLGGWHPGPELVSQRQSQEAPSSVRDYRARQAPPRALWRRSSLETHSAHFWKPHGETLPERVNTAYSSENTSRHRAAIVSCVGRLAWLRVRPAIAGTRDGGCKAPCNVSVVTKHVWSAFSVLRAGTCREATWASLEVPFPHLSPCVMG